MGMIVRMATNGDFDSIVKLLKKGKLNTEGIEDHLENFMVVEHEQRQEIIGTAGLEVFEGRYGLLRSLAFDSNHWDMNMGMEMIWILLAFANRKGVTEIFLLTRSVPFFRYFGFQSVNGEDIPRSVKESTHFQQYMPDLSTISIFKLGINRGC